MVKVPNYVQCRWCGRPEAETIVETMELPRAIARVHFLRG